MAGIANLLIDGVPPEGQGQWGFSLAEEGAPAVGDLLTISQGETKTQYRVLCREWRSHSWTLEGSKTSPPYAMTDPTQLTLHVGRVDAE